VGNRGFGSRHPTQTGARIVFILGIATSTWTEVRIGSTAASDVLFFAGGLSLLLTRPRSGRPRSAVPFGFLALSAWLIVLGASVAALRASSFDGLSLAVRVSVVLVSVPLFVVAYGRSEADLLRALAALVFSAAVNGLFAALDLVLGLSLSPAQRTWSEYPPLLLERAVGLTAHPNILGLVAAVTIPLTPMLFSRTSTARGRVAVSVGAVLIGCGLLLSGSRGGGLGALAGLLLVAVRSRNRGLRNAVVGVALGAVLMGWWLRDASLVGRLLGNSSSIAADQSREANLAEGWNLVSQGFPFGVGFSEITKVHSGLLAILAAGGVLSVAGFATWATGIWRAARFASRFPSATIRTISVGCVGSMVSVSCFLLVSPIIFHRYAVVPPAVVLAISRLQMLSASPSADAVQVAGLAPRSAD